MARLPTREDGDAWVAELFAELFGARDRTEFFRDLETKGKIRLHDWQRSRIMNAARIYATARANEPDDVPAVPKEKVGGKSPKVQVRDKCRKVCAKIHALQVEMGSFEQIAREAELWTDFSDIFEYELDNFEPDFKDKLFTRDERSVRTVAQWLRHLDLSLASFSEALNVKAGQPPDVALHMFIDRLAATYRKAGGTPAANFVPNKEMVDSPFATFVLHIHGALSEDIRSSVKNDTALAEAIRRYFWSLEKGSKRQPTTG